MTRRRRVPPVIWTLLCILVFALGVTPYAKTADLVVIAIRMSLVVLVSILGLREWWKHHHQRGWNNTRQDAGNTLLRRWRRWATDDQPAGIPVSQIVEGGCTQTSPPAGPNSKHGGLVTLIFVILLIAAIALWHH